MSNPSKGTHWSLEPLINEGSLDSGLYKALRVTIYDSSGNELSTGGLVPFTYDTIDLSYTGDDLTGAVYKLGATTKATLTLTYTGDDLTKVVRT